MYYIPLLEYPRIIWHSPSPFHAIAGRKDILEIKTNTDDDIKDIKWYKDGVEIQMNKNFSFIGTKTYVILN